MELEYPIIAPPAANLSDEVMLPLEELARPSLVIPPRSPAQVEALEQVFAAREQESNQVAGLFGMWTGVHLLHNLALEAFSPAAGSVEREEEEARARRKPRLPSR